MAFPCSANRPCGACTRKGSSQRAIKDELDGGRIWLIRSYGEQTKVRPSVQLQVTQRRFTASASDGYTPSDRTRIVPSVGLLVWRPRYKRARYMRDVGPLEDLQRAVGCRCVGASPIAPWDRIDLFLLSSPLSPPIRADQAQLRRADPVHQRVSRRREILQPPRLGIRDRVLSAGRGSFARLARLLGSTASQAKTPTSSSSA